MDQQVIAVFKAYYVRQSLQEVIQQMDTSGVYLREYWKDHNILKATDNIKMAWEEVTASCLKGMWHKIWPTLDMLIKDISETAEEAGLDNVYPWVLERHSQPLSTEELYDLAQKFTEHKKEDEDEEDHGTKDMQTKDLTDILSAIDMAAEKLCDIDPDWERSSTVKRGKRSTLHP